MPARSAAPASASPTREDTKSDCTFTFVDASEKPLRASVFVIWQVSWTASDGSGGSFGRAVTGAPFSLEVDEAQAVTD